MAIAVVPASGGSGGAEMLIAQLLCKLWQTSNRSLVVSPINFKPLLRLPAERRAMPKAFKLRFPTVGLCLGKILHRVGTRRRVQGLGLRHLNAPPQIPQVDDRRAAEGSSSSIDWRAVRRSCHASLSLQHKPAREMLSEVLENWRGGVPK